VPPPTALRDQPQRDLKPQNLLLSDATATPLVKIADVSERRGAKAVSAAQQRHS